MELNCLRCGHNWIRRLSVHPKVCPKCKTPYWDKPKKKIPRQLVSAMCDSVIKIHDEIIVRSGGICGVRDAGGIYHSVYILLLTMQKNYKNPYFVGATIYELFAKRHHFNDGNKRTAHIVAKSILVSKYGLHLKLKYGDALPFLLSVARAKNPVSFTKIVKWLTSNCVKVRNTNDIETYLKVIYYDAINETKKSE